MEPVTHLLTGACLARSGFNRRSAYATLVMVLAAEAPDLDTLWSIRGPIAGFTHHRGWTHTFLGLPVDAAVVVGAVWLWHRWRTRGTRPAPDPEFAPAAGSSDSPGRPPRRPLRVPVRWPLLYLFALIALLSHLLLDWTNNYGLRPFFPFNPRWYAGSFVFIFEPVMFGLLLLGLVAPSLFGLIGAEVGARREPFRGRGWAIAALVGVALLWSLRGYERLSAEDLARGADYGSVPILRATVSPYPVNPFRWHSVVETPDFFQVGTVDTLTGQVATTEQEDLFYKPPETRATLAAKRSPLGHAYLDWSSFPLVTQESLPTSDGQTVVTFRDLRFLYNTFLMDGRDHTPLTGQAFVNDEGEVTRMSMDDRSGR